VRVLGQRLEQRECPESGIRRHGGSYCSWPFESQKCRNRRQTRNAIPQPGWTPGEDSRQCMASILGIFCAANFGLRTLI
jgi:hypothetical protein